MKKTCILAFLALLLVLSSPSHAQLVRGFGFKVGATGADQDWQYAPELDITFDPDTRWGLNAGFFVEFLNLPYVSVVTEVNYTQKGMKYEIPFATPGDPTGTLQTKTFDNRLDYLNLKILGKIRHDNPVLSPYLLAGPRFEYQIIKDVVGDFEVIYDDFDSSTFGFTFGAGAELMKVLPFAVLVEFHYNHDMSEPFDTHDLEIKNQDIELKAGVRF